MFPQDAPHGHPLHDSDECMLCDSITALHRAIAMGESEHVVVAILRYIFWLYYPDGRIPGFFS